MRGSVCPDSGSGGVRFWEPILRLLARAQEAGEARKDTSIDDVIRFVMGITSGPFGSQEQRDRVLSMAIDGIRA